MPDEFDAPVEQATAAPGEKRPARMAIHPPYIAELLGLPDGVSVVGAGYDAASDLIVLRLTGTPHDGMDVDPTFTNLGRVPGRVEFTGDWNAR